MPLSTSGTSSPPSALHRVSTGASSAALSSSSSTTPLSRGSSLARAPSLTEHPPCPLAYRDIVASWVSSSSSSSSSSSAPPARKSIPSSLILPIAREAVSQLGPLYADVAHLEEQLADLQSACNVKPSIEGRETIDRAVLSKFKHHKLQVQQDLEKKRASLREALLHLNSTTMLATKELSERLRLDTEAYTSAMKKMKSGGLEGVLTQVNDLEKELMNVGDLTRNQDVEIILSGGGFLNDSAHVEGVDGGDGNDRRTSVMTSKLIRAKVIGQCQLSATSKDSMWTLKTFHVVDEGDKEFQEGFDIEMKDASGASLPFEENVKHVKRIDIYAKKALTQTIKPEILQSLKYPAQQPPRAHELLFLFAAAEESRPHLETLCDKVLLDVNGVSSSSSADSVTRTNVVLKSTSRVVAKANEKYGGDYRGVTDFLRVTLECATLPALLKCLQSLARRVASPSNPSLPSSTFTFERIKNRLMDEYDAEVAAGYRDMLINLKDNETQHIVELQLTLQPLLQIKNGLDSEGGHEVYEIARLLGFFRKSVNLHRGALTLPILEGIENGLIHHIEFFGSATPISTISSTAPMSHLTPPFAASKSASTSSLQLSSATPTQSHMCTTIIQCEKQHALVSEIIDVLRGISDITVDHQSNTITVTHNSSKVTSDKIENELKRHNIAFRILPTGDHQFTQSHPSDLQRLVHATSSAYCALEELTLTYAGWPTTPDARSLFAQLLLNLSKCSGLRRVLLYHDKQVVGQLPPEMFEPPNCQKLRTLCLNRLSIDGPIPSSIGRAKQLEELLLWGHHDETKKLGGLSGTIPRELGNLTLLRKLQLQGNRLTGEIPEELGLLTNLETLRLGNNLIHGTLPTSLLKLSELRHLNCEYNKLTGSLPIIGKGEWAKLETLELTDNKLEGPIHAEFAELKSLKRLHLNKNLLSGRIPSNIGDFSPLLEKIVFSDNLLEGPVPQSITNLTSLKSISLSNQKGDVKLNGDISFIFKMAQLGELILWGNKLQGTLPFDLATKLPDLFSLSIRDNIFSGTLPYYLPSKLKVLKVQKNQFTGSVPYLGSLIHLKQLGLQDKSNDKNNFDRDSVPWSIIEQLALNELTLFGGDLKSLEDIAAHIAANRGELGKKGNDKETLGKGLPPKMALKDGVARGSSDHNDLQHSASKRSKN